MNREERERLGASANRVRRNDNLDAARDDYRNAVMCFLTHIIRISRTPRSFYNEDNAFGALYLRDAEHYVNRAFERLTPRARRRIRW